MSDSLSYTIKLDHLALIAIRGNKAADFLQGQLTCDIRQVNATQTHLAAHCNAKGRVLSTCRVIHYQNQLYLLIPKSMQEIVIQQLKRYAVLSKVILEATDELHLLGCVGNSLAHELAAYFTLPTTTDAAHSTEHALIIRIRGDQTRFLLLYPKQLPETLSRSLQEIYPQMGAERWQLLDIQSGIPSIYPNSSELFTPHMINYTALNAVSFNKGCYTGQEVVARTEYLGKSKRGLWLASIVSEVLPLPGENLYSEQEQPIGTVVDAAFEAPSNCQLLAVINNITDANPTHFNPGISKK